MGLGLSLSTIGCLACFAAVIIWLLARIRFEQFEAVPGQILDLHMPPGTQMQQVGSFAHGRFRFRYVVDGRERIGSQLNPWGVTRLPQISSSGEVTAYYSRSRDEAYLDVTATILPPKPLMLGGLAIAAIGLTLLWAGY